MEKWTHRHGELLSTDGTLINQKPTAMYTAWVTKSNTIIQLSTVAC